MVLSFFLEAALMTTTTILDPETADTVFIVRSDTIFIANSDSIFYGDITLSSQEAIDAFGALGTVEIIGNLVLGLDVGESEFAAGQINLTSLNSLLGLKKITGSLIVISTNLTSLSGLDSLTSVNADLIITEGLVSLSALENLVSVGGNLTVSFT